MVVIGLIGGVASGKSRVGRIIAEKSGVVLNADQFAHELLASEAIQNQLRAAFGDSIVVDGQVDRVQLAEMVFGNSDASATRRKLLESILHPPIRNRTLLEIERIRAEGDAQFVVIDAPLLLEADFDVFCDEVWFIDTPIELRARWAKQRGWAANEITRREKNQLPIERKKKRADRIIQNHGNMDQLREQIENAQRRVKTQ